MPHTINDNSSGSPSFPAGPLEIRIRDQQLMPKGSKSSSIFYRNLQEALDVKRANHTLYSIVHNTWQVSDATDFSSNDILSLGFSGLLREEFTRELAHYPDFSPGSGGSRLVDGNYSYIEQVEREIADFHLAEAAIILSSGYDANLAVWTAIPRPGDAIVYDALVHASTHDGVERSLATVREEFSHNDVDSFRSVLLAILATQPLIRNGKRSVLIAVESFYSMEGDVCPLEQMVEIAEELFPDGNAQFVVDEAHSNGVAGEDGIGLVSDLGLERAIAVRVHTFSKAMAANGAVVLGNSTIISSLVNFARSIMFTTAPSFPFVAAIRAGYNLLKCGKTRVAQTRVQDLVKLFLATMTSHPGWNEARRRNIIRIIQSDKWEEATHLTHIVPIYTSDQYLFWLFFHLARANFSVFPVTYPVVPKGQSRMRLIFHAKNTDIEVERLAEAIFDWVEEVISIQDGIAQAEVPSAASQVYTWMALNNLEGFGMA